jgi:hypothetical protein
VDDLPPRRGREAVLFLQRQGEDRHLQVDP